jgi:hypothetical protein
MTTVSILPISGVSGEKSYRAIAGEKQCVGKTAGQALDGLSAVRWLLQTEIIAKLELC